MPRLTDGPFVGAISAGEAGAAPAGGGTPGPMGPASPTDSRGGTVNGSSNIAGGATVAVFGLNTPASSAVAGRAVSGGASAIASSATGAADGASDAAGGSAGSVPPKISSGSPTGRLPGTFPPWVVGWSSNIELKLSMLNAQYSMKIMEHWTLNIKH